MDRHRSAGHDGTHRHRQGASSGLGVIIARALAKAGARVILAVRNETKGHQAAETMPGTTEVRLLDLSSLASVRAFAASATPRDAELAGQLWDASSRLTGTGIPTTA